MGGKFVGGRICILRHWSIRLILAYSWARFVFLVAGKDIGGIFLFLLFLYCHSCSFFFPVPISYLLHYLFSPFLWETTQNDQQGFKRRIIFRRAWSVVKKQEATKGVSFDKKIYQVLPVPLELFKFRGPSELGAMIF